MADDSAAIGEAAGAAGDDEVGFLFLLSFSLINSLLFWQIFIIEDEERRPPGQGERVPEAPAAFHEDVCSRFCFNYIDIPNFCPFL